MTIKLLLFLIAVTLLFVGLTILQQGKALNLLHKKIKCLEQGRIYLFDNLCNEFSKWASTNVKNVDERCGK